MPRVKTIASDKHLNKAALGAAAMIVAAAFGRDAAAAAPDFLYVPAGGAATTAVSAAAGATVSLNLYLQAQTANGSTVLTNDGGLGTAGLAVTFAGNSGIGSPAKITAFTLDTTDFSGPGNPATLTSTSVTNDNEGAPATSGVKFGNTGGGASPATPANEIFLATITFQAGTAGSKSAYSIGAIDPSGGGETLTNNKGFDVDTGHATAPVFTGVGTNVSTFTINVAGTPEPAAAGLFAAAGMLALRRRRQRT